MRKIFTKYLSIVTLGAMFVIAIFNYYIETKSLYHNAVTLAEYKLDQLELTMEKNQSEIKTLKKGLDEDYITRAKAFAYIIKKNEYVLYSQYEMNNVKELLNVDELHVIDGNGILRYGTVPHYFRMDFSTTEQTKEFLQILEDPNLELVQDLRPNGAEGKLFQYVGVARLDEPGIVQIGMSQDRYLEASKKNEWSYIVSNIPMDEGTSIMVIDEKTNDILAHTNKDYIGKGASEAGLADTVINEVNNVDFYQHKSKDSSYTIKRYGRTLICIEQENSYIYAKRSQQMLLVTTYLLAVSIMIVFVLDFIIRKRIINGIYQIMGDLKRITNGNLDTVVNVVGTPEFKELSSEINQMVQSILDTTVKMSKIIDMVDMPIGAFEINNDMSRVLVTERVGELLHLSKEEERRLFDNKELFLEYINSLLEKEEEEAGVCKISDEPERYMKIREVNQEPGIFGIILEVTDEVIEKKMMIQHSDYDALTGLCNRRKFEREVRNILEHKIENYAATIMFDLDKFKLVNDGFGHEFGDIYLKHIADIFKQMSSDKCITGRRSGDEFYVFVYDCLNKEEIYEQIRLFYSRLKDSPITFPDGSIRQIKVSAGVAFCSGENDCYERLLNAADEALYKAKELKTGGFCEYSAKEQ